MAVWIPWLADAARLTGYPVSEVAGWRTLGHGGFRVVEGVTAHHTADGPSGDYPSFNVVRNGRAGLAGPLSNYGLGRTGRIQVIAAGACWHAGASRWAGFTDLNDEFIGIEAESVGSRDDWTAAQRDCYPRLVAAALYYMRRDASRLCGHKECALPLGRKVDPAFWNLNEMRNRVAWLLADPLRRIPRGGGVVAPPKPVPPAPVKRGGIVIPIELPATPMPKDLNLEKSADWPWVEKVFNLGFVQGWRGKCNIRVSFGHPGGRVFRAHFDTPVDGKPRVIAWKGLPEWPGYSVRPPYLATSDFACEAPAGPTSLMISYAAPGGGSLNVEWER